MSEKSFLSEQRWTVFKLKHRDTTERATFSVRRCPSLIEREDGHLVGLSDLLEDSVDSGGTRSGRVVQVHGCSFPGKCRGSVGHGRGSRGSALSSSSSAFANSALPQ